MRLNRNYFLLFILVLLLNGCSTFINITKSFTSKTETTGTNVKQEDVTDLVPEPEPVEEPEPKVTAIELSAIGDILIHNSVYKDAFIGNNLYDFKPMFELVKPYIEKSDIAFANQETVIGGVELGLSSYPCFNSPVEIGDALKDAGVDIVAMANNHTLDKNEKAVPRAIDHWNIIGMQYTGAYQSFDDQNRIRVMEKDGIKVAFLAYTYGTNGIPVPKGKEYLVNLIDREKIKMEIYRAEQMADVVALSLHFGNEYERMPNGTQQELVQFAVDEGADIILGTHPHVLQPVSWMEGKNGNRAFVMYSLGNFLSAQDKLYRQIGGIASIEIQKVETGENIEVTLQNPKFLPTYVQYQNWKDYKIIPMYQLDNNILSNSSAYYQEIKTHMSQWVPELEFIEKTF